MWSDFVAALPLWARCAQYTDDPSLRAQAVQAASYEVAETYILFVASVEFAYMKQYQPEGSITRGWQEQPG